MFNWLRLLRSRLVGPHRNAQQKIESAERIAMRKEAQLSAVAERIHVSARLTSEAADRLESKTETVLSTVQAALEQLRRDVKRHAAHHS